MAWNSVRPSVEARLRSLGKGVLIIPVAVVTVVLVAAALGLVFPVVHSHCLVKPQLPSPEVKSSWGFNWFGGGFPNPAPDGEGCIRNTPTREALSAIGIWPLGSPEHQIAKNLLE